MFNSLGLIPDYLFLPNMLSGCLTFPRLRPQTDSGAAGEAEGSPQGVRRVLCARDGMPPPPDTHAQGHLFQVVRGLC